MSRLSSPPSAALLASRITGGGMPYGAEVPRQLGKAILDFLATTTQRTPVVQPVAAPTYDCGCFALVGYPEARLTTTVSAGLAAFGGSMWRGAMLGYELLICVETGSVDAVKLLSAVVHEEGTRASSRERRRVVEANGIYAPGYPPHVLFADIVALTPELLVRRKLASQYVQFLHAVPIDDVELRQYDRNIPAFVHDLAKSGRADIYPRS